LGASPPRRRDPTLMTPGGRPRGSEPMSVLDVLLRRRVVAALGQHQAGEVYVTELRSDLARPARDRARVDGCVLHDGRGHALGGDVAPVPRGVRLRPRGRRLTVPNVPRTILTEDEIVMNTGSRVDNVVLVHGGFVDGSGWQAVYNLLKKDGYNVSIVQNPTLSLEGDAKPPGKSSTRRTGRSPWSATPTAGQ